MHCLLTSVATCPHVVVSLLNVFSRRAACLCAAGRALLDVRSQFIALVDSLETRGEHKFQTKMLGGHQVMWISLSCESQAANQEGHSEDAVAGGYVTNRAHLGPKWSKW